MEQIPRSTERISSFKNKTGKLTAHDDAVAYICRYQSINLFIHQSVVQLHVYITKEIWRAARTGKRSIVLSRVQLSKRRVPI